MRYGSRIALADVQIRQRRDVFRASRSPSIAKRSTRLPSAVRSSIATAPSSCVRCRRRACTPSRRRSTSNERAERSRRSWRRSSHYSSDRIEAALREKREPFRWLKRKIPHDVAERVRALGIDGIGLKPEETGVRYVPSRAACIDRARVRRHRRKRPRRSRVCLRWTTCAARPARWRSKRISSVARSRSAIPPSIERAVPGKTLVLSLDSYIQFEAERLVEAGVKHLACEERVRQS